MSGTFLEENTWDYDPVDDEEEPKFDQIVAQNLTDQQFIEENVQLPTSEPAPEVTIAPPPEPAPASSFMGEGLMTGQPTQEWTPPPVAPDLSGEFDAFPGGEGMLPPTAPPDPFENNWLLDQINQNSMAYDQTQQALNSLIPTESLLDERMTPERLTQLENSRGFGVGPLAGLNHQIAQRNIEFMDVSAQLDAMNPENFTTQSQIDRFNGLVERYATLQGELHGLVEQYADTGNVLIDQQAELADQLIGDEGLIPKFNQLYGPGGLLDQRREVARFDQRGTMNISDDLYSAFREGLLDYDISNNAFTETDKLVEARVNYNRAAQQQENADRRYRERIEIGATSEQFSQFRNDPGFQEYVNNLLVDRAPPEYLQELGISQLSVSPGASNDYRQAPTLLSDLTSVATNAWGAVPDQAKELIGRGIDPALLALEGPARGATTIGLGGLEFGRRSLELGGETIEQLVNPSAYQARSQRGEQVTGLVPTTISEEGFRYANPVSATRDIHENYESLPWLLTLSGEILLDPYNLVGFGSLKSGYKTIRFANKSKALENITGTTYDIALRSGTIADTEYIRAADQISATQLTKIDTFKLVDTQARFSDVVQKTLGVGDEAAAQFGNRVTFRMYTSPQTEWQRILNEELGRMGERSTKVIDSSMSAKFNSELGKVDAFSRLSGSSFWDSLDGKYPQAITDTPQWRKARKVALPNQNDITDVRAGETPQLDNLVAVGHGPKITMQERWGDLAEISADNVVAPQHRYRPDYLTPQNEPVIGADAVTDDMMKVLERQAKDTGTVIEKAPTNLKEYDEAWKKVIEQRGNRPFPTGRTINDIPRDPRYQAMVQNAEGTMARGVLPDMAAAPVDTYQIGQLYKHSYYQNRNLIDDLAANAGTGPAFSAQRYYSIVDTLPATNWQKSQIKKMKKKGKAFPQSAIDSMTTWDANEIIWSNNKKKYKDKAASIEKVTTVFEQDPERIIRMNRDELFKTEMRASIADLLTSQGEGRYTFSRPVKRANGSTAAGWARLTRYELLNAIAKADQSIFDLEHYGPALSELAENVRRMSGIRSGTTQVDRAAYPQLMADSRNILDSLIDEITQIAPPAETYEFHKFLVKMYDSSYLPRANQVIRRPEDFYPNSANMIDLAKVTHEIGYRQSERAGILDKMDRFKAIAELASDDTHRLNWDNLAKMDEKVALKQINDYFDNPNAPMTRDGFADLVRMAKFMPPGSRGNFTFREVLKEYRDAVNAERLIRREISDFGAKAQAMADKLGVDGLDNLTSFNRKSQINDFVRQFEAQYPDYARYDPNYSAPFTDPVNRKLALKESSQELAYSVQRMIDRGKARETHLYTPPVWEAPIFEGRPRYISRGNWENNPELNQRLGTAFAAFNAESANKVTVDEVASKLVKTNIPFESDDLVSQALLVHGYSFKEISDLADVSQNTAKRLRAAINKSLTEGTSIHPTQIAKDAKAMREAIDIAENFHTIVSEQPKRIGDLETSKIRLVAGKLQVPDGLVDHLMTYLDDQYKLSLLWQPGDLTKRSANWTREKALSVARTVLEFFQFEVRDRVMASRVMNLFGDDGAQYIRPEHQRPVVPIFDPFTQQLKKVDWKRHGSAYDFMMRQFFGFDEVWGKTARRFTPAQGTELTKMSKGVVIGNNGALIGHTVMSNIMALAKRTRENVNDVYSDIMNHMDQIVEGGPMMDTLYGDMFRHSDEMQTWLRWARARDADGVRMWDKVTENWGDLIPHLSISQMPKSLHDRLFTPMRTGVTRRSRSGNRAPVLRDVKQLDDFVMGRMDLSDLSESERLEAELWRDALSHNWDESREKLKDGISGEFRKGVHVDDLDALFGFDATDPYDPQRFADALGTMMTYLEHDRLGYHPDKVSPLLKWNQGVKATFGFVWLRTSPRYVINNGFGNYSSIGFNQFHSDRATGVRVSKRIQAALDNRKSSIYRIQNLGQGIASTETRWGGPGAAIYDAKKKAKSLYAERSDGKLSFIQNSPVGAVARGAKDLGKRYVDFNARATDLLELDSRNRVWVNEFEYAYQSMWEKGLDQIDGLDPLVRDQIAGELELSDISRILNEAGVSSSERSRVFRAYNVSVSQAHMRAYKATKDVMRDYLVRNRFDNALDQIFPYHFWMTKNLAFVTGTVLDRPATVLQGARIYDAWSEEWDQMPYSFKEKVHIKKVPSFVPGIGGKEIAFRPHNMTNPAFFILPAVVDEMRDAWERYDDMPIYERMARTFAGGGKQAWEEIGYSAGPHIDGAVAAFTSNKMDAIVKEMGDDNGYWKDHFDSGVNLLIRPQGFEAEILPLGGLEDAALWAAGTNSKTDVARNWYAWVNQHVKGAPLTRAEVNKAGFIAYEMVRNGDITEEDFDRVQKMIVGQQYSELDKDPIGARVLDRMYKEQGQKSWINYTTAISYTEYGPEWKEATEANKTYQALKIEDEFIPIPPNATRTERLLIQGLNSRIEELHVEQTKELQANGFSPESIARTQKEFNAWNVESGLGKIYNEAVQAGITVPQLSGDGPSTANEWAFGKWNPVTEQREGGNAPWLGVYWRANDNQEDLDRREAQDAQYQENQRLWEITDNQWLKETQRRGETAPYWNQIDEIRNEEQTKLRDLYGRGLSDTAERRLEDQIMDDTRRKIGTIYDAAEQAGISLRGSGNLPQHTSAWYDLSESSNNDIRYVYEQAGLGVPRDKELLTLDQAISMNSVEDQIEAHTTWAMRETIDALDLNPYLPNGEPNPRFMVDGYFNRELWMDTVQREAGHIVNSYDEIVKSYKLRSNSRDAQGQRGNVDLLARPIDFDEFMDFAQNDVLSRQSAFDIAQQAALDKVFSSKGDERERLVQEGIREFGPEFGDIARGKQINIDMDQVATTISNHYNGLTGEAKQTFEEQWGDIIIDGGDVRVIDPEALTYKDAVIIADRYGLEIPTYSSEFQLSRGRQALVDTWDQLSKAQKSKQIEEWEKDDLLPKGQYDEDGNLIEDTKFIIMISGNDDETGAPYTFPAPNWDALNAQQVSRLIKNLEIPVDSYFPDPNEDSGTTNPRAPGFQRMLEKAATQKQQEVIVDSFRTGEAFLDSPEDVEAWQSVQNLRDQYPDLYDAGKKFIDENGLSWEWLVENLDPTVKAKGEDNLTLREFAEMYTYTLDEADYGRLINERRKWLRGEGSQYADLVARYLDERDPTVVDAQAQADAGTLYGFEGDDLTHWQEFYGYIDAHDALYQAAQTARSENDLTWGQLAAMLQEREGPSTEGMTLKEFVDGYLQRIEDYDMGRLWDQRAAFFTTEHGQSLVTRSPDDFARYLPDDGSSSGGGSSGGSRRTSSGPRRTSGGRSFGSAGSSARRPSSGSGASPTDYPSGVRDIFRLDTAMATGDAPDAQARYDVATQVADIITQRLQWAVTMGLGDYVQLMSQMFMMSIKKTLGDNPTLDLWQQILEMLGGGDPPPTPSQELLEQPEAQELIPAD